MPVVESPELGVFWLVTLNTNLSLKNTIFCRSLWKLEAGQSKAALSPCRTGRELWKDDGFCQNSSNPQKQQLPVLS